MYEYCPGTVSVRLATPTVVDAALASHYGLSFDADGARTQRIPTDARGGLLSQGCFLKRTTNGSDFRRAIHRGLWTLTRLLCREMPRLDAATLEESSQWQAADKFRTPVADPARLFEQP